MRLLAFSLLSSAAFGWELPWLDRPGEALLGAACAALALGDRVRPELRSLPRPLLPKRITLADELDEELVEELGLERPYLPEEEPAR